jgi:predicted lysophospholipase L1 biosynthesis ABC-type transport system permease subunit
MTRTVSAMRVTRLIVPFVWIAINVADKVWWLWTLGVAAIVAGVGGLLASLSGSALAWTVMIGVGLFLIVLIAALGARGQREVSATHRRS